MVGAVRDMAGSLVVAALMALAGIVRNPAAHPAGVVVLAARELLDRAIGRPGFVGTGDNDGVPLVELRNMTDEELADAIERARLDAAERDVPALPLSG